jgi:hypothetical protein
MAWTAGMVGRGVVVLIETVRASGAPRARASMGPSGGGGSTRVDIQHRGWERLGDTGAGVAIETAPAGTPSSPTSSPPALDRSRAPHR